MMQNKPVCLRCLSVFALTLICLLTLRHAGASQTVQEHAQVDALLKDRHRTNLVTDADIDKLKSMGKQVLPLLADYLADKDLGFLAESVMQRIDANAAMPYLLKNLSNRDRNIQGDTFRLANRKMMEYDWYVRSGKPSADPTKPAPRYPRNIELYPYRKAIHDAAVKCLQIGEPNGAESEALKTVGLTGDRRDIPLLRQYATKGGGTVWEGTYHTLSIAAMARLGDKQALQSIAVELAKPVSPQPAEPYRTNSRHVVEPAPGAVAASHEDGERMRTAAFQAGFSMNRCFIALLLRHMDDPPGQFHGDYADPSPAHEAMNALSQIVYGQEYAEQTQRTPEQWKQWGLEHIKEYDQN